MTISAFSHSFRVAHIDISKNLDTRLNIQKRREKVIYASHTDIDKINLAYSISKEINSDNALSISDRSYLLPANRVPEDIQAHLFNGGTTTLTVDKFQVTDVFTTLTASQESIPLFYKHILKQYTNDGNNVLVSIKIVDSDLEEVNLSTVSIDDSEGIMYSNLLNTFDPISGTSNIYYIKYTIQNDFTGTIKSYIEILDNQDAFILATTDDLDTFGVLIPTHKVYLLDEITDNSFEVTVPLIGIPYAIRENPESRINIQKPAFSTIKTPWFLKVSNGHFFTGLPNSPGLFRYNVPEFNSQLFNPFYPYKLQTEEFSTRVTNHLVKLLKNHIYLDIGFYISTVIYNEDGTPRVAISSDPSLIGTSFSVDILYQDLIRSVDRLTGIVDILVDIKDTDILKSTYYFEEKEYEILDIDFNPLTNRDIVGNKVVFYTVPNTSNVRSKTVYYLIVNKLGIILDTNQSDNSSLLSNIGLGTLKLNGVTPSFEVDYSINGINSNQYLVLAEVFTNENSHPDNTVLFDTRVSGGGIKNIPELIRTIAETSGPEVVWTYGIAPWGGFQFPGNAAYLIEVPTSVQKTFGGRFSDQAIKELVERHTATGIYTIARGYNCYDLKVSPVPATDSITITWRSFGNELHSYDIYISNTSAKGPFIKANPTPILDNFSGNTATFDATPGTRYWIYVVPVDNRLQLPNTIIGTNTLGAIPVYNIAVVDTYNI